MGRFTIEEECRVAPERLYAWYTDFSGQDADLMRRYGTGSLIERRVDRLDEQRLVLTQRMKVMGRTIPATIRIEKHPQLLTYDAHLEFGRLAKQERRYTFTERDGGTLLRMEVEYTPLSRVVKFLDAIGFLRRLDMKESRATTVGYLRAAEAELLPAGTS
jgi:hypothetical protein